MKRVIYTFLLLCGIMTISQFATAQECACKYSIEMTDSFGDGWDDSAFGGQPNFVTINGGGASYTFTGPAAGGPDVEKFKVVDAVTYNVAGQSSIFAGEVGFKIIDKSGNTVVSVTGGAFAGFIAGGGGSFTADCQDPPPSCNAVHLELLDTFGDGWDRFGATNQIEVDIDGTTTAYQQEQFGPNPRIIDVAIPDGANVTITHLVGSNSWFPTEISWDISIDTDGDAVYDVNDVFPAAGTPADGYVIFNGSIACAAPPGKPTGSSGIYCTGSNELIAKPMATSDATCLSDQFVLKTSITGVDENNTNPFSFAFDPASLPAGVTVTGALLEADAQGDLSFFLETWRIRDENGSLVMSVGGTGFPDCTLLASNSGAISGANINTFAADGSIDFTANDENGFITPNLCGGTSFIEATLTLTLSAPIEVPASIVWYDAAICGNIITSGPNMLDLATLQELYPTEMGSGLPTEIVLYAAAECNGAISARTPVRVYVFDCSCNDDGCPYFLVLQDIATPVTGGRGSSERSLVAGDGWDGAYLNVMVNEEMPGVDYTVSVAQGSDAVYKITVQDGGFVDFTYFEGANNEDHYWHFIDTEGVIQNDILGVPLNYGPNPPSDTKRFKANNPNNTCENTTEDFEARVTMGAFPEAQSWEITNHLGQRIAHVNAETYAGSAPGQQFFHAFELDLCEEYEIALQAEHNIGWFGGIWEMITPNIMFGTEIHTRNFFSFFDSRYGQSQVLLINFPAGDILRQNFTIPCKPVCPSLPTVDLGTGLPGNGIASFIDNCIANIDLDSINVEACYPQKNHAVGCIPAQRVYLLVHGMPSLGLGNPVIAGDEFINVGAGNHKIVYEITYCDNIVVKCTTDLNIVQELNPELTCNDNVLVSLAQPVLTQNVIRRDANGIPILDANGDQIMDVIVTRDDSNGNFNFIDDLGECYIRIKPDMVLEMPNQPECLDEWVDWWEATFGGYGANLFYGVSSEYVVTVMDENNEPLVVQELASQQRDYDRLGFPIDPRTTNYPVAHDIVGPEQAGKTLVYKVTHIASGTICWGHITVEDKNDPVIVCNDYDLKCTHPNALDENYSHTETYSVTESEMPGNIAGGTTVFGTRTVSNTWLPINVPCMKMGEVVQDLCFNLNLVHNDISDLRLFLHAPASMNIPPMELRTQPGGSPIGTTNVFCPDFDRRLLGFRGLPCTAMSSTVDDVVITENVGSELPPLYGNTWYLQVIDNNIDTAPILLFGGGEVTLAEMNLTCGFPTPYDVYDCTLESVTLLSEEIVETACNQQDWFGAAIHRTWQAIDAFGNSSTCVQRVNLIAPALSDLTLPADTEIECDGNITAETTTPDISGGFGNGLECSDSFGDAVADAHGLCDITYTYMDKVVWTCGNSYTIIRTWTYGNWCTSIYKTHEQTIDVKDTTGPSIGLGDIIIGTNAYTCDGQVDLDALGIEDACSGVKSVKAHYNGPGSSYNPNGQLYIIDLTEGGTIDNLPLGNTGVRIIATDNCGNRTDKIVNLRVEDDTVPIAICDDQLNVSLGSDGTTRLYAEDVDEGSSDNCSAVTLEVRRVDGCLGTSAWGPYVDFACCDRDELVTVELRVTDAAGNTNTCWKQALIEDALAPIITVPADKTINCDELAEFGEASAEDNCTYTLDSVDGGELDNCKAGILTKTWTADDGSEKSANATGTQRITVLHVSDFIVQFPADVTLTTCPDELGNTGAPTFQDDDCELVSVSHTDQVFDIVDDACYKIVRTWIVSNWCTVDLGSATNTDLGFPLPVPRTFRDDGDGYMKWTQIIKVIDGNAPVIDCPGDQTFCDLTDGCEGHADLTITAEDDCSEVSALNYAYQIDLNNDGTFDLSGNGSDASGTYAYGTHRIQWMVNDGCGNMTMCEYNFEVKDCKAPTPTCINGLALPVMELVDGGCVEIWASDFLLYATDNCTEQAAVEASVKMRREGTSDALSTGVTFCCEDLGTQLVEIWVEDEAGNADRCNTYVIVQDNAGYCPDGGGSGSRRIKGDLRTTKDEMVDNAEVMVEGLTSNALPVDENGFIGMFPMNSDYNVTVETKEANHLNGISGSDIYVIVQHLLSTSMINDPYMMIAADVTNDKKINVKDIIALRRLILHIDSELQNNEDWRFFDADVSLVNPFDGSADLAEIVNIDDLNRNEIVNFVAVKIGDLTGDAKANANSATGRTTNGSLGFSIDEVEMLAGNTYTVDFRASDFNEVTGYQFTLNFDAAAVNFAGIKAGALSVTDGNFGTTMLEEGVITTSWTSNAAQTIADDAVLFSVELEATSNATLSNVLAVSSRYTVAEAYTSSDMKGVELSFNSANGTIVSGGSFALYQNKPNPFAEGTVISFNLPEAGAATVTIYDVSGRVLKSVSGDYTRGYNEITVNRGELATGVMYYQLDTDTNSATKKMIMID